MGSSILPKARDMKSVWRDAAIAAACAALASSAAIFGHDVWQQAHNTRALQQLTANAIKQAEYNIDYAILAAFEVAEKAPEPCSAEGQTAKQAIIHRGSNIKNVFILDADGKSVCGAFQDAKGEFNISAGTPTRNETFALHRLAAAGRDMVGVSWKVDSQRAILVAFDLEAQMFATMPAEIRDDARNSLSVAGLGEIAGFGQVDAQLPSVSVMASSARFPVSATLVLDKACYVLWNGENRELLAWLGALIGLLLSGIAIRELRRPMTPQRQLQLAIANDEIRPFAQATFDLSTRHITGCEILMRWVKPDGEIVPPARFVPLAEATNMIVPMTRHIMKTALAAFAPFMNTHREFKVAFNVVPHDFVSPSFAAEMLKITKQAGIATRQVVLEITERQAMDNLESLKASVAMVRDLGFKVALDDMGTGHNGLANVQDVPLDMIKIDKKFVDATGREPVADAIVEMLVGLANRLGLKTTAEGIETETQRAALLKLGVSCGQGYLVGKPVPIPEFLATHGSEAKPLAASKAKRAA
jgi:c-di-GMP phosphodiesterase